MRFNIAYIELNFNLINFKKSPEIKICNRKISFLAWNFIFERHDSNFIAETFKYVYVNMF